MTLKNLDYRTADYTGEFESDIIMDLTKLPEYLPPFDIIICYHVLEHIEDDILAMKNLFKLLKPGGHLWVQTPFAEGEIFEDSSIQLPVDRKKFFGQWDHVRVYSVEALTERLRSVGFTVEIKCFKSRPGNTAGLKEEETIILGRR